MFKYYVTYFIKNGTAYGYGKAYVTMSKEIRSASDVEAVAEKLKESNGFPELIILNWILLPGDEPTES
jgi:hypothetical protein